MKSEQLGDRYSAGFWSGLASSLFSVGTSGYGGMVGRTTVMAVVGGTVSGAFVHMFNAENVRELGVR